MATDIHGAYVAESLGAHEKEHVFVFGNTSSVPTFDEPGPEPAPSPGTGEATYVSGEHESSSLHASPYPNAFADAFATNLQKKGKKTTSKLSKAKVNGAPTNPDYSTFGKPTFQFGLGQQTMQNSTPAESIFKFGIAHDDPASAAHDRISASPGIFVFGPSSSGNDSNHAANIQVHFGGETSHASNTAENVGMPLFSHPTSLPNANKGRLRRQHARAPNTSPPVSSPSLSSTAPAGTATNAEAEAAYSHAFGHLFEGQHSFRHDDQSRPATDATLLAEQLRIADGLQEARRYADDEKFVEACRACLPFLSGPAIATDFFAEMLSGCEAADRKRVLALENEKNALRTQLNDARERCGKLQVLKEAKVAELKAERTRSENTQRQLASLQPRVHHLQQLASENHNLKQQLKSAEGRLKAPPSQDVVVRQLARLECEPLRGCSTQARAGLKKKLLLKWHPDKQPSTDHSSLATLVMQELQNRDEWLY